MEAPSVIEHYKDYHPPSGVKRRVEMLARRLPPKAKLGLGSIVLTNSAALSRDERRRKTWSRGQKVPMREVAGWYERAWENRPASIRLLVDNTLHGMPAGVMTLLPPVVTLTLASVLYHEVGHHIHATIRPEHNEREDVADRWSGKLMKSLMLRRYWYLVPPIAIIGPPILWLMKRRQHGRSS